MCGIVGARHDWLVQRGIEPAAAMAAATRDLAWRGPNGQHWLRAGGWWLGCARLAISGKHSRQPVVQRGGRYVGILNGAVTNARQLWARFLPGAERRPAPPNDAWLPLLAVAAGAREALQNLRGHHAYAVVDTLSDELVFGQDRFGEKPFFCLVDRVDGRPALAAFASTPAALRQFGMPAVHAPRRLAEWFRQGWAHQKTHRFTARFRLEPVPDEGPHTTASRTWCAPWAGSADRTGQSAWSPPPIDRDLRRAVIRSVADCVDTQVPVGLSLSGGIDSSCLAIALRELGRVVPSFQLRAAGADAREREAAAAVAARCGLPLRPVDVGPEVLDALPRLTALAGRPLGDPSILAVHALARAAAADGVRVLLAGEGADERFFGYRRYRALLRLPHLPWLSRWLGWCTPHWSMHPLLRLVRAASAPDPAASLLDVACPAFAATVLAEDIARRRGRSRRPPPGDRALQARRADFAGYLRCDLLPKVDIATLAAGVEARCPFLVPDFDLDDATVRELGKRRLRSAFGKDLPASVLELPKRGFALPLDRWFRGDLPWLDLLAEPRTQARPHLLPGGINRAVTRHRRGRADLGHALYLLVACELHLRSVEGAPAKGRC